MSSFARLFTVCLYYTLRIERTDDADDVAQAVLYELEVSQFRLKALSSSPDWRRIERKVPRGICLRPAGTMTVKMMLAPVLRYLTWLPRWETNAKPSRSRAFTICCEE